tara:strand:- start:200 stop:475 length:276 start_codon:yes stop_codon:yes gene_type:complete
MKITKSKLKEIIKEEVAGMEEPASPRMNITPGIPPVRPGEPPPPETAPPEDTPIKSLKDVFHKILNSPDGTLTLNKSDATMLAGLIAPYGE